MNIYVGNLSNDTVENDLKEAFENFGDINNINILKDRYNGLPRGFAFIEMKENSEAEAAIEALNGTDLCGRNIVVNEARQRENNTKQNVHYKRRRQYDNYRRR